MGGLEKPMDQRDWGTSLVFDGFRLDRRGLFRLDPTGGEQAVALGSRALDLLRLLARREGEVVPKDAIIAAVWQGLAVEESNLTVQIANLRRVLDRDRAQGSCIQTISGRGYRLTATVTRVGDASQGFPDRVLADKPSIAVLPFRGLGDDPEHRFIADGMAEAISTALSRIRWVFVIASGSSLASTGKAIDVKQSGAIWASATRSQDRSGKAVAGSASPPDWSRRQAAHTSGPAPSTAPWTMYSSCRTKWRPASPVSSNRRCRRLRPPEPQTGPAKI
jgi:DNA-binding winged helix-turn-helix (wHTH) protein